MPYFGRAPAAIGTIANVIEGDLKVKGTISGESINDKFAFDTAADLDDHFVIEDGGTDGSATNAGDNMLLEDTTQGFAESVELSAITDRSGTSGQFLTSGGAGAASSFTTVTIPEAAWEFLEKVTASSSSTVDIGDDSNVVAGYDYIILFDAADFSADQTAAGFVMQFGTGSTPTYQTSTVYATQGQYISTSTEDTSARLTSQAGINIGSTTNINIGGAGANETVTGEIYIFSPASSRKTRCMMKMMMEDNSAGGPVASWGYGERAAAEVVTSFRIKPTSGTITSGDFTLCRRKIA